MDLTQQKSRYGALANKLNEYAERSRAGEAQESIVVTLNPKEAAETLIALGNTASSLAWALGLPGDDTRPEIVNAVVQLDDVLDAMATIWQSVATVEEFAAA